MKKEMSNISVILRMIKLVKPLTLIMCLAIIMGVLGYLCAILIPVLSSFIVLKISGMPFEISLSYILIILLALAVCRGVFHYVEQACNHYIAFKLLAIIRDHVYTALRRLAPAKLDSKDKGNLISMITNDIELLEVFYAHTISPIFIAIITCTIMLIIFYKIHPLSMCIALCFYLVMAVVIPLIVDKMGREKGMSSRNKIGNLSSYVLESFRGVATLQQYHHEVNRKKQMMQQSQNIEHLQYKLKSIESMQTVSSQLCITLSALIMLITMYLSGQGVYSTICATILMLSSFGPVLALSSLSNNLLSTLNSGRRVISLLDEKELITDVKDKDDKVFGDIEFHRVTFGYDDEMILEDIDTRFPLNQITGIIGKSGSGKSTLLKLMMRFYDPNNGDLQINQTNIKEINTKDMRKMFAYVTQETILFHDTLYNNLKIANLNASEEDIIAACQRASIHEFISQLPKGYHTMVSELGGSLSAGERQRIGLARAFLSEADCILLDEPTSNLDVLNEAVILKSLCQCKQTVILVSHRPSTMKIAHQILKMKEGRMS